MIASQAPSPKGVIGDWMVKEIPQEIYNELIYGYTVKSQLMYDKLISIGIRPTKVKKCVSEEVEEMSRLARSRSILTSVNIWINNDDVASVRLTKNEIIGAIPDIGQMRAGVPYLNKVKSIEMYKALKSLGVEHSRINISLLIKDVNKDQLQIFVNEGILTDDIVGSLRKIINANKDYDSIARDYITVVGPQIRLIHAIPDRNVALMEWLINQLPALSGVVDLNRLKKVISLMNRL